MKPEIMLVCATALVIALLWFWQERYEVINDTGVVVTIVDRWTGCVTYYEWDTVKGPLCEAPNFSEYGVPVNPGD